MNEKPQLCSEMSMGWREEEESLIFVLVVGRRMSGQNYVWKGNLFPLYAAFLSHRSLLVAQKPQDEMREVLGGMWEVQAAGTEFPCCII